MAPIAALFTSVFVILCSHGALAAPDPAILPRGDVRPRFTPAASMSDLVTNTYGFSPTGTGSSYVGPTGTGYIGTPSAIPPYPYATPCFKRPMVDTPSGGYVKSGSYNTTIVGPTRVCTNTVGGTGVVGPTGTGATAVVSATGAFIYPIYHIEKDRRSQKAARNWWA